MDVVFVRIKAIGKAAVSGNTARNCLLIISRHGFIMEVDRTGCCTVRAAEVEDELAVNEYPQVVVTGEVEGLGCAVFIDTVAATASVQVEGNGQLHTKALVMRFMIAISVAV